MKELLLLRHAKSSWAGGSLSDHDRPLNGRGQRAARRIACLVNDEGLCPDIIYCSTAVRAQRTAEEVATACGGTRLVPLDELYLAGPRTYVDVLVRGNADVDRVCMVGHNPGMEQLVGALSGEDVHFVTACLAHIRFECTKWQDVVDGGTLLNLWYPRELGDAAPY